MKKHKPYTLQEVKAKSKKDYSWRITRARYGRTLFRKGIICEGIGCYSTDPRGDKTLFASVRRHFCGEVTVNTTRTACMTMDALLFAASVMRNYDALLDLGRKRNAAQ